MVLAINMHERDFNAPSPAQELARPPLLPSPDPDLSFARPSRASSAAAAEAWSGRAGIDGRQIFFLFLASALGACLIFAAGLSVGRRIERKALTQAQEAAIADPLAALDDIANAEEALTFHRALLSGPAAQRRAGGERAEGLRPYGPPKPRFSLRGPQVPKRALAEPLLRRLRDAGYRVSLVEVPTPGGTQFQLQVGDFPNFEGAQPIRSELASRYKLATTVTPM